jgi:dolichyl-phosphate-mannose-protein mannosyltransferase
MTPRIEPSTAQSTAHSEGASPPMLAVTAGFALLVLVLRGSTFFHSVENWDESLYLLMARSVLDGHTLYTEIWDHKPPGIFYLFALAQLVFGRTVLSIRIATWLAITASSVLLFLIGRRLRSPTTGVVAGLLYAVFSLNDGGIASNVELFFTPLLLLALLLVVSYEARALLDRPSPPLLLGLVAGLALQMKYVVIFDLAAFFLLLAPSLWREAAPHRAGRLLRCAALVSAGAVLPLVVVAGWFAACGHFADYVDANFAANARYVGEVGFDFSKLGWMIQRRIREAFPLWLSLALAPLYLGFFRSLDEGTRRGLVAGLLWAALAFVGILAMRRLFAHYFLSLTAPLCLLCALVVCAAAESPERAPARTWLLLALVLLGAILRGAERPLLLAGQTFYHRVVRHEPLWGDEPAQVAEYLRSRIGPGDYLYVADYHPILYYLLPVRVPTRFPLPPHLADDRWKELTGFDPEAEIRAIFAKKPLYIVKVEDKDTPFYRLLREELERSYQREHTIGAVTLYRRKDEDAKERKTGRPIDRASGWTGTCESFPEIRGRESPHDRCG